MAKNAVDAARALRARLDAADEGGYGQNGWYFYLDRQDVDAVVEYILSPAETAAVSRPPHGSEPKPNFGGAS